MRACLSCSRLIRSGSRCPDCQRAKWRAKEATRNPRERQLYGSATWQKLRLRVLEAADGRCQAPTQPDGRLCGLPCDTVGHVIPLRQRPDLALEPSNLRAECRSHQRYAQVHPPGALMPR